ncbi:hypothetical protein SCA6_007730 [Theobroma cacao]
MLNKCKVACEYRKAKPPHIDVSAGGRRDESSSPLRELLHSFRGALEQPAEGALATPKLLFEGAVTLSLRGTIWSLSYSKKFYIFTFIDVVTYYYINVHFNISTYASVTA